MMDATASNDLLDTTVDLNESENGLSPEEKQRQNEILMLELQEVEKEIVTLKTVLGNKVKRSNEIKRKLGISVWSEMRDSAKTGITDLKSSNAYKNTVQAAQVAKEKTSGVLSTAKEKLSTVTTSTTLKTFGEKVGSAYSNVKQSRSFMDFRFHSDKLKIGATGPEASLSETQQGSGPSTLEEAISADKESKTSTFSSDQSQK